MDNLMLFIKMKLDTNKNINGCYDPIFIVDQPQLLSRTGIGLIIRSYNSQLKLYQWQGRYQEQKSGVPQSSLVFCLLVHPCQLGLKHRRQESPTPLDISDLKTLSFRSETNKDYAGLHCSLYWNNKWEKEILFEWQKLCSHIYNVFVPLDTLRL